jgi:rhamnulokinase
VIARGAAVDLGASSGRVFAFRIGSGEFSIEEVARFANGAIDVSGTLYWDALGLYRGILSGITEGARRLGGLDGIGIDSWAVDYGLIDDDGVLVANPVHHRDHRTVAAVGEVERVFSRAELYARTGIAHQRFNTIFQLAAERHTARSRRAERLLLIPDLFTYWLTGAMGTEVTNASTTQLMASGRREWDLGILAGLGIAPSLLPALRDPGDISGMLTPGVLSETGIDGPVPVIAVGSHDTASAVAGVPASSSRFAYVSCGTWSLVGLELDRPVVTEASQRANFTNELGVDGTVRFLRNVMGLWLLQEVMRSFARDGLDLVLDDVLERSARIEPFRSLVDANDPRFLEPGEMPARIAAACAERGEPVPSSPEEFTRCILDSLAVAYAKAVSEAEVLSGVDVEVIHLVGGGAQNALLCQLTANASGRRVVAGPVEAAAIGNAMVQARALGAVSGDLFDLRAIIADNVEVRSYEPNRSMAALIADAGQRLYR